MIPHAMTSDGQTTMHGAPLESAEFLPDAAPQRLASRLSPAPRPVDRIAVKCHGRVLILRLHHIDWIEAQQDYVALHMAAKSHLIRETISDLSIRLASAGFIRIHRSTLVNVDRVRELRPLSKGEYTVVLLDGAELKLSRSYRGCLRALTGYGLADA